MNDEEPIEAYFLNELSKDELDKLEHQLKENPEKRKDFVRESFMRSQLRRHFRSQVNIHQYKKEKNKIYGSWIKFAASIFIGIGIVSLLIFLNQSEVKSGFARVVELDGKALLGKRTLKVNEEIGVGHIKLESGSLRMVFSHGSELLLMGPCEVKMENELLIHLVQGNLAARMSEEGEGFTVKGPDSAIVDLGTEFAYSVEGNDSWVEVYDGEVDVALIDEKGQAWKNKNLLATGPVKINSQTGVIEKDSTKKDLAKFPTVPLDGLEVGEAYVQSILKDKPISYYNFSEDIDSDSIKGKYLGNVKIQGQVGVHNQALHFPRGKKHHGTFSLENIPPEFYNHDFTIEFWLKPSFSQYRSICELQLNNVERHAHSKLFRLKLLTVIPKGIYPPASFCLSHDLWPTGEYARLNSYSAEPYRVNQWHHLAIVKQNKKMMFYLNGDASDEIDLKNIGPINESCRLVFGAEAKLNKEANHFKGLIDEISLYNKALSVEQISQHFNSLRLN